MRHHRPEWGDLRPTRLLERLEPLPLVRDAVMALGHALGESVDRRTLEHVVLRIATLRDSRYEWVAHTNICLRNGFLTAQEIASIAAGADQLTGADAATVQAVDDLLALGRIGAATRLAVGERELPIKVTTLYYNVISALAAGLEPEAPPVPDLETPALATAILKGSHHA
jgi:hypothetical protein